MVSTRKQCNHNADCSARPSTSESACNVSQSHKGSSVAVSTRASTSHSKEVAAVVRKPNLLELPTEIIQKIVSYNGYKSTSDMRLVCKRMDDVCGSLLNSTFYKLQNAMLLRFQNIKSQMPRRESARRQHALACESDIIETLHMRLTLLQMSFGKHIERKHCCFFAGEILDEVHRILYYIKVTPRLARPYKVTDELFDLTSMAMEYFKEKIEPRLPEITYFGTDFFGNDVILPLSFTPGSRDKKETTVKENVGRRHFVRIDNASSDDDKDSTTSSVQPHYNMVLRKRMRKIKQGMKRCNSVLSEVKRELRNCKAKVVEQQKTMNGYAVRLEENEKKSEEMSRKYGALMQELNKCKTELQYWRTKAPLTPACDACGNPIATINKEDLQALHNQGVEVEIPKEEIADKVEAKPCEASTSLGKVELLEGGKVTEILKETPSSSVRSKKEAVKLLLDGGVKQTKMKEPKMAGAITRRMDSTSEQGCSSRTIGGITLRKEDNVKTTTGVGGGGRCVSGNNGNNKRKLPSEPTAVNAKKIRPVVTLRSKAK